MYLYKNISDIDFVEVIILNYLARDKSRCEIIRTSQINGRELKDIAGFWVNTSELKIK